MRLLALVFSVAVITSSEATTYAVDGDTINVDGERIRVMGVDTPETFQARCASEFDLGKEAQRFTAAALARGPVRIARTRKDRYGRTLARVFIGGRDLAELLIGAGLGREYHGERRQPWC